MIPGKFTMDVTLGVIPTYAIFPRALFPESRPPAQSTSRMGWFTVERFTTDLSNLLWTS